MMIAIRRPFASEYPVTQLFGENPDIYSRFGKPGHNGVDFGVPIGTPILAAADGVVERTGWDAKGYGHHILLCHDGFLTLYAHLNRIIVSRGEKVKEGQHIGDSGNTGFSTGPHLHFELRIPGAPGAYSSGEVDPLPYVKAIENETLANEQAMTVKANKLNVRMGPSLMHPVVGQLNAGDIVSVVGYAGDWARIVLYVHRDYLG